ncbi:MAG: preprotein translocase subunit SecG [Proteobacteria bacterium]|nr:preprotein translocase subunit SecG [Pseudomonadota bacterium]
MVTVLVVIHLMIATSLIVVVLLQRSEGGGLGIGSSGGMGGFMTARGTANLLTRTTAVLAACFMASSILLAVLSGAPKERRSIVDAPSSIPASPLAPVSPVVPAAPTAPAAPIAR